MSNTIFALVVTYNRKELLKECLAALLNQLKIPDKIIIYNNNSTDGTTEYLNSLSEKRIMCIHAKTNTGGAGGFFYGIKKAYELGADWIWVMDDDTIAKSDALELLINCPFFPSDKKGNITGYLASRIDWIDGKRNLMNYIKPVFPWHYNHGIHDTCYKIQNCSFVSMLINRQAIKECGYPIKEFFIWGDDWEYSGRISSKFDCYYISNSVVIHKTDRNYGAHADQLVQDNYWKFKYQARNFAALWPKSFFSLIEFKINLIRKIRKMRRKKIKFRYLLGYIYYSFKGLFFNYKKKIQFPEH